MSKKSRKRNKKILAVLAAGLGAAALMKRRKAGEMSGNVTIPDSQKEGFTSNYITKKSVPDVLPETKVVKPDTSGFQTRFTKKVGNKWMGPNEIRLGNINPHEATAAAGAAYRPHRVPPGKMRTFKKGGRVTGIAKRGFGRALMKGKK